MQVWVEFLMLVAYFVASNKLFDNYWGLAVLLVGICVLLYFLAPFFIFRKERKAYKFFRKKYDANPILIDPEQQREFPSLFMNIYDNVDTRLVSPETQAIKEAMFNIYSLCFEIKNNVHDISDRSIAFYLIIATDKVEHSTDPKEVAAYKAVLQIIEQLRAGINYQSIVDYLMGKKDSINSKNFYELKDPDPLTRAYHLNDSSEIYKAQHDQIDSLFNYLKNKELSLQLEKTIVRLKNLVSKYDKEQPKNVELYNYLYDLTDEKRFSVKTASIAHEYEICLHIVIQLTLGKNLIYIANNLLTYGDAYEPEKEE